MNNLTNNKILSALLVSASVLVLSALPACAASDGSDVLIEDLREKTDKKEADQKLDKKESLFPQNAAGHYLASRYARAAGNIPASAQYLYRAFEKDPQNMKIAMQLQGLLLIAGDAQKATDVAKIIVDNEVRDPLADLLLALSAIKKDNFSQAKATLKRSSDDGNLQLWVPLLRGWTDVAQGTLKKPVSKDIYEIDVGQASALVNYHLALLNAQAGYTAHASKLFEKAIEDPKNPPLRIMVRLGEFYETHQQPESMKTLLDGFIATDMYKKQKAELADVKTAKQGVAEVLYTMGSVMYGAGVLNDTVIYLQLANFIAPDQPDIQMALGDAYTALKQYDLAFKTYGSIAKAHPLYERAQIHVAVHYDRIKKTDKAIRVLHELSRHLPNNPDPLVTKGDLYRMHNQCSKAIKSYDKALVRMKKLVASDWPIFFARASCLERLGNWSKAKGDLQTALRLNPNQPDVLNYLGYVKLERGENIDEAYQLIAKAVSVRPDDAQIIDSMGWILFRQGQYEQALQYIERATELLPSDPTVNDHLGDLYWRLDRKTEAKFQWQRALTYAPKEDAAKLIRRKLEVGLPKAKHVINTDAHAEIHLPK